ncbi:unnamed protein product [Laminaria digitata]
MSTPSLSRAHDLVRKLRLEIRRIEVVETETGVHNDDDSWTASAIEAFNNSSVRTIATCRDALADARYEADQGEVDANDAAGAMIKVSVSSTNQTGMVQAERDLEHVRAEVRRAVASRKRYGERHRNTRSRTALMGTQGNSGARRRGQDGGGGGDAPGSAAGEAREMKQSLQRTRKMMAEQLARVAQVSEIMGEQDALLRHTFDEHQASLGGSLRRAGTTLTRLKVADVMDAVVMVASTLFFFGTVCFVLYQRLPLLGLL